MSSPRPRSRADGRTPLYVVLAFLIKVGFLRPFFRRRWSGAEHLPARGGVLVAANHITPADPLTTAHFLYDHRRAPKIMAKASLWKVPVLGWFLRGTEMIPVVRGTARSSEALRSAEHALASGQCVLIFPEGTLTKDPDLWPMVGKPGVARLALATGAPVIPVAQWGAQQVVSPDGRPHLLHRATVQVAAGPAVDLSDLAGRADRPAVAEATARIMRAITELEAGLRGEPAPAGAWDPRAGARVPVDARQEDGR